MELLAAVEGVVLSLAASPWVLLAVALLAALDGFFPPVPSESVLVAAAVLAVAGAGPSLWALVPAAAVGAFAGDVVAYGIGRRIRVDERRLLRGRRGSAALAHARRTLARRGGSLILSARFVPVGRVAVKMTAGAVGYPRPRFLLVAVLAAALWASGSTLVGVAAGAALEEHPLAAVAVGTAGGLLAGLALDRVLGRRLSGGSRGRAR